MNSETEREELGKRLKMARTIKNLNLDEVAKSISSTKSAVSRYESGKRKPSQDILKKFASIYNVPLNFLENGTFYANSQPSLLIDFNETGSNIEMSKEELEMTQKLLVEKVKQVLSREVEKLEYEDLFQLLSINKDDLRGLANIIKNPSLVYTLSYLTHAELKELEDIIDKW